LIDEVSETDTFTMTIPGNTRKFYRAFLRHREKMRRKRKTYLWQYGAGRPIYSLGTKKPEEGEVMLQHLRRKAEMTGRSTER
jgi:hypothetical protein